MIYFEKTPLFQGMSPEFLAAVKNAFEPRSYGKRDTIFSFGDQARHFYVLQQGRVRLKVGTLGSVSRLVSNLGEAFGWSSLVGQDVYTATAICMEPVTVLETPSERLYAVLEADPANGMILYRRLARLIRARLIESYKTLMTYDSKISPQSYG